MRSRIALVTLFVTTVIVILVCSSPSNSAARTLVRSSAPTTTGHLSSSGHWLTPHSPYSAPTIPPTTTTTTAPLPPPVPVTTTTTTAPVAPPASVPSPTGTTAPPAAPTTGLTSSGDYDHRWDVVAACEEGGWGAGGYQHGPNYWGNLGISSAVWDQYGYGVDRNNASPAEQVTVASRIQPSPPDQNGCGSW